MNFNELSWAGICFYYRSIGDQKYCKIMRDTQFISKLREAPFDVNPAEFEEKVLLDYVNIESYDLLIGHDLAKNVLTRIIELHQDISSLQDVTLLDCDLSRSDIAEKINNIYMVFFLVPGLWMTGVSKIIHILNNRLFAIMGLDVSNYFRLMKGEPKPVEWMKLMQQHAQEVTDDFHQQGFSGSPEAFLSEKLSYTDYGCEKSLVKFVDEFYWLRYGDNLPVPPRWVPPLIIGED